MSIVFRILIGTGLFALGYYLGREVGRSQSALVEYGDSEPNGGREKTS